MKYRNIHRWDISPTKAIDVQSRMREKVIIEKPDIRNIRLLAGVDVSVKDNISRSAIVVLTYPDMKIVETVTSIQKTSFPYIPGLLSFREGPVILEGVDKLSTRPDLFIFDGQGLAHPRGIGLASHLGIILDTPSIGSAKSHLYGKYDLPGDEKGDFSVMKDNNYTPIGAVLCTRSGIKPVFVSPGHRTDIVSSVKIILTCSPKYKIPEPIRAAHNAASLVG